MANNDEGSQSSESTKSGFGGKQWIATRLTILVVVFVFAFVFPSLGNYSDAWTAMAGMSTAWIIALALSTVGVIFIYPWPFQAALPGLKYRPLSLSARLALVLIASILRSESSARKLGDWGNEVVDWVGGLFHKKPDPHLGDALVSFRSSTVGALSGRKGVVTDADAIQQLSQFAVTIVLFHTLVSWVDAYPPTYGVTPRDARYLTR